MCVCYSKATTIRFTKPFNKMPGPKGLPKLGVLHDYLKRDGLRFNLMFQAMQVRAGKYGPVVFEKIADFEHVIVTDPLEYKKVIHIDGKYPKRIEMEPMAHYRRKHNMSLGTVNSQGEEWHRHRRVLNKKLLSTNEVDKYITQLEEVCDDFVLRLYRLCRQHAYIKEIEFELFKWAMECIGTVLFAKRLGCFNEPTPFHTKEFIENLLGFFTYLQRLMYGLPFYKVWSTNGWRNFEAYCNNIHAIGQEIVKKEAIKERKKETSSFMNYLLSHESITAEEAYLHTVDLLMGAVETTANAMLWTLICLAKNPQIQEKAYIQIEHILGDNRPITADLLAEIKIIKACLKEALRLYPITFATSRIISEDIELGGYFVPAGTHVQANLYGMGRSQKIDMANSYIPERWIKDLKCDELHLSYLPFGHGSRMCIGRRLAELEIFIGLIKVIKHFKISFVGRDVQPVLKTVMTPDRPVQLNLVPRSTMTTNKWT